LFEGDEGSPVNDIFIEVDAILICSVIVNQQVIHPNASVRMQSLKAVRKASLLLPSGLRVTLNGLQAIVYIF
jgi:hypothetical protein